MNRIYYSSFKDYFNNGTPSLHLTNYEYFKILMQIKRMPCVCAMTGQAWSNSSIKKVCEQKGIVINGKGINWKHKQPFKINDLTYFPKGKSKSSWGNLFDKFYKVNINGKEVIMTKWRYKQLINNLNITDGSGIISINNEILI